MSPTSESKRGAIRVCTRARRETISSCAANYEQRPAVAARADFGSRERFRHRLGSPTTDRSTQPCKASKNENTTWYQFSFAFCDELTCLKCWCNKSITLIPIPFLALYDAAAAARILHYHRDRIMLCLQVSFNVLKKQPTGLRSIPKPSSLLFRIAYAGCPNAQT